MFSVGFGARGARSSGAQVATYQVDNIAAMQALTSVSAGETINVLGYYTSGDGGGDLFQAVADGSLTDGGTVFGFDEHLSAEQTDKRNRTNQDYDLGNANISWGTVTWNLLDSGDALIIAFDGSLLHGHLYNQGSTPTNPFINLGTGWVDDSRFIYNHSSAGDQFEIKYKYLTNSMRAKRVGITDTLYFDWFGTKTHDIDPDWNNQPYINWAYNASEDDASITKLKFAHAKVYEYYACTQVPDGVTPSGQGGTELDSMNTDDLGNEFYPVVEVANPTRLRVKANRALDFLMMENNTVTDGDFPDGDNWTGGAGWAFGGGKANASAGSESDLSQAGTNYAEDDELIAIFTVSGRTQGSIFLGLGGTAGASRSTNSTFTETITCGAGGTPRIVFTKDADFDGSIDDVDIRVVKDFRFYLEQQPCTWRVASGADSCTLENFIMDGNLAGNTAPFVNNGLGAGADFGGFSVLETWCRNSPGYTGFTNLNQGTHVIPIGQAITLTNMGIMGYAGTCLLSCINALWTTTNVRCGDSVWNHCWYALPGTHTNLTFFGAAWTHCIMDSGTITNLVFESTCTGTTYRSHDDDIMNFRGPDISTWAETPEPRHELFDENGDGTGEWCPLKYQTVSGFYTDLRTSSIIKAFGGIGPDITLEDGIFIPKNSGESWFWYENASGNQDGAYQNFVVDNIEIFMEGSSDCFLIYNGFFKNASITNVWVYDNSTGTGAGVWCFGAAASWRDTGVDPDPWAVAQVWTIDNFHYYGPHGRIIKTNCLTTSPNLTLNISNSTFNNTASQAVITNGNSNATSALTSPADVGDLAFNFISCSLNEPAPAVSTLYDDTVTVT